MYGVPMSKAKKALIFGEVHQRGIVRTGNEVKSIKVILDSSKRYPNQVNKNDIRYCLCKSNDDDNLAMRRTTTPFPVHVVSGNKDYYWGDGLVDNKKDDVICWHGTHHTRFFIYKAESAVQSTEVTVAQPDTRLFSHETYYNNTWFDSHLEACHAVYMDVLSVKWKPQPIQINDIQLPEEFGGGTVVYIPDFSVHFPDHIIYLEIKPAFPYAIEEFKCMALCQETKNDVVLLYNKNFTPFSATIPDENRSYMHSSAIRGLRYSCVNGSISSTEVAWAFCDGMYNLVPKRDLFDTRHRSDDMLRTFTEYNARVKTSFTSHT